MKIILTDEQVEVLCKHFNKDARTLEEWQVGELMDLLIDEVSKNID